MLAARRITLVVPMVLDRRTMLAVPRATLVVLRMAQAMMPRATLVVRAVLVTLATAMLMRLATLVVLRMAQAMMPRAMPVIRLTVLVMLVMVRVMMDAALVMARMLVTGMLFAGGLTVFRMMRRVLHTSPCTLLNSWRGMPRPMSSFKLISRRGLMPVIPFSILMELR